MKRAIAAFVILLASGIPIHAQDWPTRPVTMVVPFPAGGPIDLVARILAPPMSELIGQQIIIENVGGARARPARCGSPIRAFTPVVGRRR
jgi:tripartite-type tricarboxylate transporter receptor subunit TctC